MTVIIFLIVLAVLIFVHELGHFLSARACGIKVSEFAIGFGPRLLRWTRGETTYALNIIPFGGYVKIFGENPDDESISGPESSRSFVNKPKWQQIMVLAAGVFFNFVFAWIIISIAFMSGVPASVDSYSKYPDRMTDPRVVITYVEPGSPAEKAGLKTGAEISGFSSVEEVQEYIGESGGREVKINDKAIVAKEGIVEGKYAIGIAMDKVATLQLPVHLAIVESARFSVHMIKAVTVGIYDLVVGMFRGTSSLSAVTGPIGIAGLVGDAASLGFTYLLLFTALISINLGVLNLVPFPALDGGRILFVLIEAVILRPIKPVVANSINAIGFILLILLMIVVTYRDVAKLFVE
ncbi:MAG: site-2 protease family protein [bacterium]|nr:site-2 protease family protein [bacterium]